MIDRGGLRGYTAHIRRVPTD